MRAQLKDLETGEVKWSIHDVTAFQWTDNNWHCDCNRRYTFKPYGEWPEDDDGVGYCAGHKRFVVVDVDEVPNGWTKAELIEACNSGHEVKT